jgi:hypothetical protein
MLLDERRHRPIASRFPGAGKPIYSDYNSISVSLGATISQQAGKLAVAATGFSSCDRVIISFKIIDKRTSKETTRCPCDFCGTAEVIIPTPTPANINAYIAENLRRHSLIASHAITAVQGDTLVWTMIRAGYDLEFTAEPNTAGLSATLTPTITTPSSNGQIPSIDAGPAVWMHPTLKASSAMRSAIGSIGWVTTPAGSKPRFLGVLRKDDVLRNSDCDCTKPPKSNCHTVIHRGAIHVQLELPVTTWPADPVVAARHTVDPAVNDGKTGGYQILDRAAAAPAGMEILSGVDIWDVHRDGKNAIIYLP